MNPEDIERISKEKNAFKPQVMAEESIINTTTPQENILLKPTKHLRDIRFEDADSEGLINRAELFGGQAQKKSSKGLGVRPSDGGEMSEFEKGVEKKLKTDG